MKTHLSFGHYNSSRCFVGPTCDFLKDFSQLQKTVASGFRATSGSVSVDIDDDWPSSTKKVFNLAFIKDEPLRYKSTIDKFAIETVTGKVDDILQEKTPIQLKDILNAEQSSKQKIVLVEGAPGSGKTTLSKYMYQKWGQGELFQTYTVAFYLQL